MANQNTFDDIAQDYKYWEDQKDEIPGAPKSERILAEKRTIRIKLKPCLCITAGSLLPLWGFVCEKEKRKQVTAVCWNSRFSDLFAVGYGSYDFSKQGPGMIAGFTLKNPSYPEFLYVTDTGIMSVDFHPQVSWQLDR